MDRVEKILMLGVLGVAMAFVAVLAFESGPGPEGTKTDGDERTSIVADGVSEGASGTAQEASSSRSLNEMLGPNVEAGGGSQAEAGEGSDTRGSGTSGEDAPGTEADSEGPTGGIEFPGDAFEFSSPSADGNQATTSMYWYHGEFRVYQVRNGDTLEGILRKHCGYSGPRTMRRVQMLNEDLNLNKLSVGQEILLPVDLLRGSMNGLRKPSTEARQVSRSSSSSGAAVENAPAVAPQPGPAPAAQPAVASRSYKVQSGDNFWSIAPSRGRQQR
jgi:hypothetical protein